LEELTPSGKSNLDAQFSTARPQISSLPSVNTAWQLIYFLLLTSLREIVRNYQALCKDFLAEFRASCDLLEHESANRRARGQARARLMTKQTKITIETDSLLILRGRASLRAWCQQCGEETEVIPLEGVGVISNLPTPEVEAWITSDNIHRSQAPDGGTLICVNSLLKCVQKTKTA
jgi:hypothetical protein